MGMIDIFAHITPPKYKAKLYKVLPASYPMKETVEAIPTLSDLDRRFAVMDAYEGLTQVLTVTIPPIEAIAGPGTAAELAKAANDELAELVAKHPQRFAAGVAILPMNDMDLALRELERAVEHLKLRGVQVYSNINGKPLDSPEFMPLYEAMARYGLPIWIHPRRERDFPDYASEATSKYQVFAILGWPYDTSVAMTRLVYAGVFDKYPGVNFITHHCGAMIPYFASRIERLYEVSEKHHQAPYILRLAKRPLDYFRMFHNDTALCGNTPALMCAHAFFGVDRLLFGTDMPYDARFGHVSIAETIDAIKAMDIPDADRRRILEHNGRRLLHL